MTNFPGSAISCVFLYIFLRKKMYFDFRNIYKNIIFSLAYSKVLAIYAENLGFKARKAWNYRVSNFEKIK